MKAEEIKILNIDNVPYVVDMMSDKVKNLVSTFNSWAQKEVDTNEHLIMIQCAKQELSRQIVASVREEVEAQKAEKQQEDTPPTA